MIYKKLKAQFQLSDFQKEVLIGIWLGDAHLEILTNGKNYRLVIEQSIIHKDYLMHLYELFQNCTYSEPRKVKKNLHKKKPSYNLTFKTLTHECFGFYAKMFYDKKKKAKDIQKFLSPIALAYWYMDDGAKKGKNRSGKRLHTEGFTKDEVDQLCEVMNKIGIATSVNKQNRTLESGEKKTAYIFYIKAAGDIVLTERIKEYIHPSMQKKL